VVVSWWLLLTLMICCSAAMARTARPHSLFPKHPGHGRRLLHTKNYRRRSLVAGIHCHCGECLAGFLNPRPVTAKYLPLALAFGNQNAVQTDVVDDYAVRQIFELERHPGVVIVPYDLQL